MRSIYRSVTFAVLAMILIGCGSRSQQVHFDDLPDDRSVDMPIEVADLSPTTAEASVALISSTDGSPAVRLQESPAVFGTEDTSRSSLATGYCGIVPAEASSDTYELRSREADESVFSLVDEDGRLRLMEEDRPVLAYNYEMQLPEGVSEEYRRSSYIHPIWGPDGTILTDDFPADHYHHRGLSWMWPRVFVDDSEHDLWALDGIEQAFDRWLVQDVGPVCATLGVKNHWRMQEDHRRVVDEWVWIRTYRESRYGRAIDIRITLEARERIEIAGRETDDKGYGGFSLRFAPREGTAIWSSEGREPEDSDLKRLPWADQSALFEGATDPSGIAIFQHVDHPDFPVGWTLRHYGFLGVAWPGLTPVELNPGEPVTLRYRVWVHSGGAVEGHVAEAYEAFAEMPGLRTAE